MDCIEQILGLIREGPGPGRIPRPPGPPSVIAKHRLVALPNSFGHLDSLGDVPFSIDLGYVSLGVAEENLLRISVAAVCRSLLGHQWCSFCHLRSSTFC